MRSDLTCLTRVLAAAMLAGAMLAGCASATQRAFVAPTSETVFSTTEERQGDPPAHSIFVTNRSTVPVTVFSISLSGCENIKQRCEPQPMNLRIRAGQRMLVTRVEPAGTGRSFSYHFGFSWHADSSGIRALSALAAEGEATSRGRLSAIQRDDSIQRAEGGARVRELSRDDFTALAGRIAALRASTDSLVLAPGQRTSVERIRILVVDSQGTVLGRTRWVRWQVPGGSAVQFVPPDTIVARSPGRGVFHFSLADEAQAIVRRPIADLQVPIVAAYPFDATAPSFGGVAVDADAKSPLACLPAVLEDSAENVVARGRTDETGRFVLNAPRPGTYRVRFDVFGWSPVYGPTEHAGANEEKQHQFSVRFFEQLLTRRDVASDDFRHATPAAVATAPITTPARNGARGSAPATPVVQAVTLGGSETMPILGIVGRAPQGTMWIQFVVDTAGRVDPASVLFPPATDPMAVSSVKSVLPRVRFSPARKAGTPTCELLRMQVNFSAR